MRNAGILIAHISGNWFAAAIKRRRRAEIKASRTTSLDISCALDLPIELLLEVCPDISKSRLLIEPRANLDL